LIELSRNLKIVGNPKVIFGVIVKVEFVVVVVVVVGVGVGVRVGIGVEQFIINFIS
jgi:hypothetical protein